jgi:hypothetical protein
VRQLVQQLESPLDSLLVRKVGLLERKKDTMLTRWQPCLAVLTSDGWLHLFDLPYTSKSAKVSAKMQNNYCSVVAFSCRVSA